MHPYGDNGRVLHWERRENTKCMNAAIFLAGSGTRNACMGQYCVQKWCAYQPMEISDERKCFEGVNRTPPLRSHIFLIRLA